MPVFGNTVFFNMGDQQEERVKIEGQLEYAREKLRQLPDRKPGDRYPLAGAAIGIVIGVVIGSLTWDGNLFWLFGCVMAGGIAGTLLGSLTGNLVAWFTRAKRQGPRYY